MLRTTEDRNSVDTFYSRKIGIGQKDAPFSAETKERYARANVVPQMIRVRKPREKDSQHHDTGCWRRNSLKIITLATRHVALIFIVAVIWRDASEMLDWLVQIGAQRLRRSATRGGGGGRRRVENRARHRLIFKGTHPQPSITHKATQTPPQWS